MERSPEMVQSDQRSFFMRLSAYLRGQGISLLFIIGGLIFILNYLYRSTTQFPLMDYWLGLDKSLDVIMNGRLTFFDFFPLPHPLHVNPIGAVFQVINARYFNANLQLLIFGAVLWMAASLFLLAAHYHRTFSRFGRRSNIISQLMFSIIVLSIFNLNQWEIMTLYVSFAFMFRIFIYILLFIIVDGLMLDTKVNYRKAFAISLASFLIILGISQAYFPAFVGAISIGFLVDWIFAKSYKREKFRQYLIIECGMILATLVYLFTSSTSNTTAIKDGIQIWQYAVTLAKGLLIMLASIFIPNADSGKGFLKYYQYGFLILAVLLISLIIYFWRRMYRVTLFPIICIFYALLNMLVIIYGRISGFGLVGLTSSRYVVETTILLIGIGYILIYQFCDSIYAAKRTQLRRLNAITSLVVLVAVMLMLVQTNRVEIMTGPYRKIYSTNLIRMSVNIDSVPDNDLAPFQAPPEAVRSGVAALKKYQLNVFHNDEYKKMIFVNDQ